MPRFEIAFKVDGKTQTITAVNNKKIRAGSKNYWYATFTFLDSSFDGLDYLSASFAKKPYSPDRADAIIVPIVNNECKIPWEMLTRKRKFYVGVFAGDMLVTNEEVIEVTEAALTAGVYTEPTQSWFNIFMDEVNKKQDKLTAGDNIEISRENEISAILTDAVLYAPQELTDEEKLQARANIGAGTGEVFEVEFTQSPYISYEYDMITPYKDFLEALESDKIIWAKATTTDNITYTLRNLYVSDSSYTFWDICMLEPNSLIGTFIKISFEYSGSTVSIPIFDSNDIAAVANIPQGTVRYAFPQRLTGLEKEQARENIGAGTDQTYYIDFEKTSYIWGGYRITLRTSYEDYVALTSSKEFIRGRLYNGGTDTVLEIFDNFIRTDNIDYFWNIIPSGDNSSNSSVSIEYVGCMDRDGSINFSNIYKVPLANLEYVDTELNKKADKINKVEVTASRGVIAIDLEPDTVYWMTALTGSITDIYLNLLESHIEGNEDKLFHFYYVAGSTAPMISLPENVGFASGALEALASTDTIVEVTISRIPSITIGGKTYNYLAYAGRMETEVWENEIGR